MKSRVLVLFTGLQKPLTGSRPATLLWATVVFLMCLLQAGLLRAAGPDLSQYELVFSDEFNGTELDPSKWNTGFLWGPYLPINNEQQLYVDTLGLHRGFDYSPFRFTGTSLKIVATPVSDDLAAPARPAEDDPVWREFAEYRYNGPSESGPGYQAADVKYLSGLLTSYDSFRFTHGYVETRMKLPAGKGLAPAFWAKTSFYVNDVPEIDVMEFIGDETDRVYHTYHYFEPFNNWRRVSTPAFETVIPDFTQGWHTFGMEWGPEKIIWYVDGRETQRIDSTQYTIANQAMYLLLNLAVGGNWPGSPDADTPFPAELEVDYVRAYKRVIPEKITRELLERDFQLMFEDEFNGKELDSRKWNSSYPTGPYARIHNEQQFYPDMLGEHQSYEVNPFSVDDGTLTITASAVTEDELPAVQAPDSDQFLRNPRWQSAGGYRNPASPDYFVPGYVSGILTSFDSFKFVNGYAEIRARLPDGGGLWPGFRLLNAYDVDVSPKIDVLGLGARFPNGFSQTDYFFPPPGLQPFVGDTDVENGGFQTFGLHWQPGRIDWYLNGDIVYTATGDEVSSQMMYLVLNLAVGGDYVSRVDDMALPDRFEVDYVRVWQNSVPDSSGAERVNRPPRALDDDAGPLAAGDTVVVNVIDNDTDFDGNIDPESVSITVGPRAGALLIDDLGRITYTHSGDPNTGTDSISYRVEDNLGTLSNEATVYFGPISSEPGGPVITSPAFGSQLSGSAVNFTWDSNAVDVAQWYFRAGSEAGADDYASFRLPDASQRSTVVSGLPVNGSRVYLEFSYRLPDGRWFSKNLEYLAAEEETAEVRQPDPVSAEPSAPAITSPQAGSVLDGSQVVFSWNPNGTEVRQWYFRVGASPGAEEYASFRLTRGNQVSTTISGLPTDGSPVYVEFSHRLRNGIWVSEVVEYRASDSGTGSAPEVELPSSEPVAPAPVNTVPPQMILPVPGSTFTGSNVPFIWTPNDTDVQQWYFRIGKSPGGSEYIAFRVTDARRQVIVVPDLPTDGSRVYVEFSHRLSDGTWISENLEYNAYSVN